MIPEVMQLHSCFATMHACVVAFCNICKDLLEQHAICAQHCTVCSMLYQYACYIVCLHVCVHLTPWDSSCCSHIQQSQTPLQTRRFPSTTSRKINLRLVRLPQCGLAKNEYCVNSTINRAVSVQSKTRQQATQYTSTHTHTRALWPKEFLSKPHLMLLAI